MKDTGSAKLPITEPDGEAVLRRVLESAYPRPDRTAPQSVKNAYAVRFADAMATALAHDLSRHLKGIEASSKRTAAGVRGNKQLDVNFSTPQLGLALGISLKSVHLRETTGGKRYTHNMKRNEEELRIEAAGYHKRQPYAVMVGVLFLPFDSCTDARSERTPSSFGSFVRHLRPYASRPSPHDELDRFERLFVALYEPDGSEFALFDIRSAPPKNGRPSREGALFGPAGRREPPRRAMSYDEFIVEVHRTYLERNAADFEWSGGEADPLEADDPELPG